jgi:hypothetical protein
MNWSYAISGVVMEEQQQRQVVLGVVVMAIVVFVCELFSDLVMVKKSYVTCVPIDMHYWGWGWPTPTPPAQ